MYVFFIYYIMPLSFLPGLICLPYLYIDHSLLTIYSIYKRSILSPIHLPIYIYIYLRISANVNLTDFNIVNKADEKSLTICGDVPALCWMLIG